MEKFAIQAEVMIADRGNLFIHEVGEELRRKEETRQISQGPTSLHSRSW